MKAFVITESSPCPHITICTHKRSLSSFRSAGGKSLTFCINQDELGYAAFTKET